MARLAGVSYTTVSHVINSTRKVAPETLERVEKAIEELRFRPSARARGLRTGSSGLIGVLTSRGHDIYFGQILSGMEDACRVAGVGLIVSHSESDLAIEAKNIDMLLSKGVDALILNNFLGSDESYALLEAAGIPLVVMHARFPKLRASIISADDLGGARMAMDHLISLGHRRIACLLGHSPAYHGVNERLKGYTQALESAGLPVVPEYLAYGEYTLEGGYQGTLTLLDLPSPPTAIFSYSDIMAMGALRAAKDREVRVPEQLSVIGFDDIDLAAYTQPRLTTIAQPMIELGKLAVHKVLERKATPDKPTDQITLPVRLLERDSTGPAPIGRQAALRD